MANTLSSRQTPLRRALWLSAIVCLAAFAVDIATPRGIAIGIIYICVVFCSRWFNDPRSAYACALVSTILTMVAYLLKSSSATPEWMVLANRAMSIGAQWLTASLVVISRTEEQKSSHLAAIVTSSDDAIISKSLDGFVLSWNRGAERLFGYTAQEAVGQHIGMLIPNELREEEAFIISAVHQGRTVAHYETVRCRKDGSTINVSLTVSPIHDLAGNLVGASKVARDITVRKREEEKFRAVVRSAPYGIMMSTRDGKIVLTNKHLENLFGYDEEKLRTMRVEDLLPEQFRTAHVHHRSRYLNEPQPIRPEARTMMAPGKDLMGRRADGTEFPIEVGLVPFSDNQETMVLSAIIDVTDRKRLEDNRRRINQLLEEKVAERTRELAEATALKEAILANAKHLVIAANPKGVILLFNPACETALGYSASEVIGKQTPALWHDSAEVEARATELAAEFGEAMDDGSVFTFVPLRSGSESREWTFVRKDGSKFPVQLTVSTIRNQQGGLEGYLGVAEDVSERKRLEAQHNELLASLRESNKELQEFAFVASHDLKAPLRVIDNASKWIAEDLEKHLTPDTRESMDLLRGRVARMEKLLDDLLEYSRASRKSDASFTEIVNGKELMDDVLALVPMRVGFAIEVDPSFADIEVMRMPLKQVLANLIGNAIKHHDRETGVVRVRVARNSDSYVFSVADDGPGIPEKFHNEIFKLFTTLKPRDQVEGSGMGLAIVRRHVERFGGTIDLESGEDRGSTFKITWPMYQKSSRSAA